MPDPLPSAPRALPAPARWALHLLAAVCLLLGLIGLFVPVVPTVPFLVIAAWAASRSSPRLHAWLLAHPRIGPPLRDWNEAGIVPRRVKWFGTVMMATSAIAMMVVAPLPWFAGVALLAAMVAILVWLWRRPERRAPPA